MTALIHALGSDIPHHNRTVLRLSNDALATTNEHTCEFMVADRDNSLSDSYLTLSVQFFPGRKSLAEVVIAKAKVSRQQRFFFHGQFNPKLWLALLSGGIKSNQFFWHIWGADLYELSSGLRCKLFYSLRHLTQKRVGYVFATHGDLSFFAKTHPKMRGELLYFLTRMGPSPNTTANDRRREGKMTILVGNSGGHSDEHIATLRTVHQQFNDTIEVVVPMGYPPNSEAYIEEVCQAGLELFSEENLQVLSEKLELDAYLTLLRQYNLGYFIFARQQDIGTLCLLVQAGIPCVLNRENPFWQDMTEQYLPVLFAADDLNGDIMCEARHQLASVGKSTAAFSGPSYLQGWQRALAIAAGEAA